MRRIGTLAALASLAMAGNSAALGAAAGKAWTQDSAAVAVVRGVRVAPGEKKAEVSVAISGAVTVRDFTVSDPYRIVLDLSGARLNVVGRLYDGQRRAGLLNIRASQYRPDVVRVVLDLERPVSYTISRVGQEVRVMLDASETFAAWDSQGTVAAAEGDVVPELRPANQQASSDSGLGAVVRDASAASAVDSVLGVSAAQRVAAAAELQAQQTQQRRITVTWQDAPIRDVIAGFAEFSGRTIVVGKQVEGTVSAEIKDKPWDVAMKAILDAHGLAMTEDPSGIIVVDSYANIVQRQASEPLTTQMVPINYVSAASLVKTVEGLLSKDCSAGAGASTGPQGQTGCITRGSVVADSGTNSLLVTEVQSRLPSLLQYIQQLDVRTPQVALKAKIVSLSRTQLEQLGVSYDLGSAAAYFNTVIPRNRPGSETAADDREGRVTLGGEVIAGVANASRKYKGTSALNLLFSTALGKYSLTSFIDALREQQLSDIQAEPSVVTLDNREARILVGQETPVRVIDAGAAAQIGTPPRANVQYKETGIILKVTPHITNNRQIRMVMEAEQSELRIIGGDLGFVIDKRNAQTQLLVNDGETAVIGGLTQTQLVRNKSGIPLLSDLPLLGRLFSQTDMREEKRDLLIMITPHIIDEGEPIRPPGNGSR
ncbi:MAG TPA: AMIN domain-containing protein [Gemmatimonadaceae bacterium]|nr:AMIN domain-containing protein [Gemmatimonadaceae bacterium]